MENKKELKQAMRKIEHHTGVSSFEEVCAKMERYAETSQNLSDMQKSLQNKLIDLYQKRDNLKRQVAG